MTDDARISTIRDRVVLLLINGVSVTAAESYCMTQGVGPDDAGRIVGEARKKITVAADYTRDEQLGRAIMRMEDLYAKSITAQDVRTAIQAQRELNRLLSLYTPRGDTGTPAAEDVALLRRQIELISGYLLPLQLTDAQYPIEEHARLAADAIRRTR